MARRGLSLGEYGEITTTPQIRQNGRWVSVEDGRKAQRHQARVYYLGFDGIRYEVTTTGKTKRLAVALLEERLEERLRGNGDGELRGSTLLVDAGRIWFAVVERTDSGLSARTVSDYRASFERLVDAAGSPVRGLTLTQVNDPQRLAGFLRSVADARGTGAAKMVRSVLAGILNYAVESGVLTSNALRQVRAVRSQTTKPVKRDHGRAFTRDERDATIEYADTLIPNPGAANPRTIRKAQATADLLAFMAGTGARIDEARSLRWEDVQLDNCSVRIRGTKSDASDRTVNLPEWLLTRLERRAATGTTGFVFASPAHLDTERKWDQSNNAAAVRAVLDGAGFEWAVPHTYRRTVASLLHEAGAPLVRIADQLGHSDPAMTARVYLGREFIGDKSDLAAHL